ncbi:MAG: hypothetical protein AB7F86_11455 [Bdellovibrionales bacterium]
MRFSGWVLSLVVLFFNLGASAVEAGDCISQTEMQQIAQHFTQFRNLADKGEYCFDGSHESHLIAGIVFMRKTQFASSMPNSPDQLFSGRFSQNWYQYFIGRISDFEIPSNCPKGVGAYVYFFGNTMYVCPMLLSDNFTALDRASVMMHEARHIDGFPHVTCTHGPRAGLQGACDDKIADGGSYAVSVETYAQLAAYGTDVHPALKSYSRAAAISYADEAFEHQVQIQRQSQFMLMTSDGGFHLLNLSNGIVTTDLGQSPSLGKISMRGQHMILYPEDKSQPARYVFARNEGEIAQQAGDIAVEYNSLTSVERAQWVDVHIGAQWSAQIMKSKIKMGCNPRSSDTTDVSVGGETPAALLYPTGYDRAAPSAHLAMESGKIYEFGCQRGSPFLRASSMTFDQRFKRVLKSGPDVLGLAADGRLFRIQGATSSALQTSLDGRIYELAPNQLVSFFDR